MCLLLITAPSSSEQTPHQALGLCCFKYGPSPADSVAPGSWLEMQNPRPTSRPTSRPVCWSALQVTQEPPLPGPAWWELTQLGFALHLLWPRPLSIEAVNKGPLV
jgi:hypothetical protein